MRLKLTDKQGKFIEEYLIDLNGAAAARRAGYSEKTAHEQAARLLAHVNIQAALTMAQKARSARTQVTQDRVLLELARLGFSDLSKLGKWGPEGFIIKSSDELTEEESACVQEVTCTETVDGKKTIKVKLHDKKGALELIGRHLSMFTDNLNHQGQVNVVFNIPRPPKGPVVLEGDDVL